MKKVETLFQQILYQKHTVGRTASKSDIPTLDSEFLLRIQILSGRRHVQMNLFSVAPRCASETTQRWWWCERIRLGSTRNRALWRIPLVVGVAGCIVVVLEVNANGQWPALAHHSEGGMFSHGMFGKMSWLQKDAKGWLIRHAWEDVHFLNPALCVFNYIECRVCFFRRFSDDLGRMDTSGWTRHCGSPSASSFSNLQVHDLISTMGVRLLPCLKKPGLYDSEQWFHGKPRWKIGCCPSQLLSPLGTPLASRHHRAQIPRSRDACEAWKVKPHHGRVLFLCFDLDMVLLCDIFVLAINSY